MSDYKMSVIERTICWLGVFFVTIFFLFLIAMMVCKATGVFVGPPLKGRVAQYNQIVSICSDQTENNTWNEEQACVKQGVALILAPATTMP